MRLGSTQTLLVTSLTSSRANTSSSRDCPPTVPVQQLPTSHDLSGLIGNTAIHCAASTLASTLVTLRASIGSELSACQCTSSGFGLVSSTVFGTLRMYWYEMPFLLSIVYM